MQLKKRVVVIGGGTGSHTLLRGLRAYANTINIQVIVSTADTGGSTGRLRDEFGYLPVGDVRMALAALVPERNEQENLLRQLFMYRFERGMGLSGHTIGNLLLVALTDMLGSEEAAIRAASQVLRTCGEVISATTVGTHLVAEYESGAVVDGEHEIDVAERVAGGDTISQLSLSANVPASSRALEAIRDADTIVLGPGDFYTSILANCVVKEIGDALKNARGSITYVANLMSKNGQTNGMGTATYVEEIRKYIGRAPDRMIVHTGELRPDLLAYYAKDGEYPVMHTYTGTEVAVVARDVAATTDTVTVRGDVLKRSLIRHDPEKLARAIMECV